MLGRAARERAYLEAVTDAVLLCLAFGVAFTIRSLVSLPYLDSTRTIDFASHAWLLLVTLPAFWFLASSSGLYDHAREWTGGAYLLAIAKPFLYLTVFLGAFIFLVKAKAFSRAVFFLFVLFGFLFVAGMHLLLRAASRWSGRDDSSRRRVLIVGAGEEATDLRKRIESGLADTMVVVGHLTTDGDRQARSDAAPVLGTAEDLKRIVEEQVVDDVVFAVPFSDLLLSERADRLVRGGRRDRPPEGRLRAHAVRADLPLRVRRHADAHRLLDAAGPGGAADRSGSSTWRLAGGPVRCSHRCCCSPALAVRLTSRGPRALRPAANGPERTAVRAVQVPLDVRATPNGGAARVGDAQRDVRAGLQAQATIPASLRVGALAAQDEHRRVAAIVERACAAR